MGHAHAIRKLVHGVGKLLDKGIQTEYSDILKQCEQ